MKRIIGTLILFALFVGTTVGVGMVSVDKVTNFAQEKNQEKTALVQAKLDETISMLEDLSEDEFICSKENDYQEKAIFLTAKNQDENLGYMMVRILDEEVNIYREDTGKASNLASRDYMQRLYTTGETQVTDAFLAGADGKTINYTVAVGMKEDGKVTSALMAAIYGTQMDEFLQDDESQNVLVGSQLQYMGGIPEEQFGLAVAQVLQTEYKTSRPVENILLDFNEQKAGAFWGIGDGVQYFIYSPIDQSDWIVLTEVQVLPMLSGVFIFYGCCIVALVIATYLLFWRRGEKR